MPAGYTVLPLTGIDGWQRDSRWFLYGFGLVPIMTKNHQEYTRTTNARVRQMDCKSHTVSLNGKCDHCLRSPQKIKFFGAP